MEVKAICTHTHPVHVCINKVTGDSKEGNLEVIQYVIQ